MGHGGAATSDAPDDRRRFLIASAIRPTLFSSNHSTMYRSVKS
jgi:hypothetical protein